MGKRSAPAAQLGFVFEAPSPAREPAALAGIEARLSRAVSTMLHEDPRSRDMIALAVTELLDEVVSKSMLDAYASPARDGHKVPMSRFLALVAVTERHDLLDQLLRPIGAAVLVGEEVHTARLGQIDRKMAKLQEERRALARHAPLIRGANLA